MKNQNNNHCSELIVDRSHRDILLLKLNRPEFSNALSIPMIDLLTSELRQADCDDEIKVIILTGMGKHFCAGGDIKSMKEHSGMFSGDHVELKKNYYRYIQQIPLTIEGLHKPIIAMVNGAAVGAGCDLACMCDLRVASTHAKFSESFAKLALVPGDGGTYFLPRIVGHAKAMEMFLTGNTYSADEAKAFNLVNFVYSSDELEQQTLNLAKKIAQFPSFAISSTKRAILNGGTANLRSQLDFLSTCQAITQRSKDHEDRLG